MLKESGVLLGEAYACAFGYLIASVDILASGILKDWEHEFELFKFKKESEEMIRNGRK